MKTKIKIAHDLIFILTALFTFSSFNVLSQSVFYPLTDCPDVELEEYAYPGSGGLLKPERTDRSSGSSAPSEARLNVLIVFYPSLPISRLGAKELLFSPLAPILMIGSKRTAVTNREISKAE